MRKKVIVKNHSINVIKEFQNVLNETHDVVKIGTLTYEAGDVLAAIDPTALRCEAYDYADAQVVDGNWVEVDGDYFRPEDLEETA